MMRPATLRLPRIPTCLATWAALLAGCATPPTDPVEPAPREWIAYVKDGTTTRDQLVTKFGEPTTSMEGRRILIYRLTLPLTPDRPQSLSAFVVARGNGPLERHQWATGRGLWSFVGVFDARGVLQRHSFVETVMPSLPPPGQQAVKGGGTW